MKKRKELEIINAKRTTRKRCYYELGEARFDFCKTKEFLKYKYICGEKLSGKEWKNLTEKNMPISFWEWEESIIDKYKEYNKEQLEEFQKYLEAGIVSKNILYGGSNILFAAIISALVSVMYNEITKLYIEEFSSWLSCISWLMLVIVAIFIFSFVIWFVSNFIFKGIKQDELERHMYMCYKETIGEIIEKK